MTCNVSFVLPCFNVEKYLPMCLESILAVDDIDFEIIIIDDCSTDNTLKVANFFSIKHNCIKVYKNDRNMGVSFSRNLGLNKSIGEFVWFVDPDDMIFPNSVRLMFDAAKKENVDMVTGNNTLIKEDFSNFFYQRVESNSYKKLENKLPGCDYCGYNQNGAVCTGACQGLYRRSFLKKHKIEFNKKLAVAEDIMFNFDVFLHICSVVKFDKSVYFIRKRTGSSSHTFNEERNKNMFYKLKSLFFILDDYIKNGIFCTDGKCSNLEKLEAKKWYTQENVTRCLAMVRDRKFVRKELHILKNQKIYPYKFRKAILHTHYNVLIRICVFLLPLKIDFWFVNFLYRLKRQSNV